MARLSETPPRSKARTAWAILPWLIASVTVAVTLDGALASRASQPLPPVSPTTAPAPPASPPAKAKPLIESWEKVPV